MRYNDLADVEFVNYLIHSAHVVGMRMSCHNIVKPPHIMFPEIADDLIGLLGFAAVDEHIASPGGDKHGIALSHVDKMNVKTAAD